VLLREVEGEAPTVVIELGKGLEYRALEFDPETAMLLARAIFAKAQDILRRTPIHGVAAPLEEAR
jgi:hypothetical protein